MLQRIPLRADVPHVLRHRIVGLVAALALSATGMSVLVSIPAAAATTDPATNIAPSPSFRSTCSINGPSSQICVDTIVAAINHARSLEGVGPMVLPSGFRSLSTAVQTFVVSNLERVDRGLQPAQGIVGSLDTVAQNAAVADADPVLPSWTVGPFSANRWGSNWAGDINALAADYDWMYEDGWSSTGSFNLDCQSAGAAGCWGHRHNILSPYGGETLISGVGAVQQSQWMSIAQIFVAGTGALPTFVVAWKDIVASSSALPPGSTAPPAAGQDPTSATIATTTTVVAGHTASIVGHLTDVATGTPIGGAAVLLCHRTAVETTGSCASMLTDSTGTIRYGTKPLIRTAWWLAFVGTSSLAASSSRTGIVYVRTAVGATVAKSGTRWVIHSSYAPVRGQLIRLQLRTATGWLTVAKLPLRTRTITFYVNRGRYRIWAAPVTGLLDGYAYVAAV